MLYRGPARDVQCEGRLTDTGSGRDENQLTGLETVGQFVEFTESCGNTGDTVVRVSRGTFDFVDYVFPRLANFDGFL